MKLSVERLCINLENTATLGMAALVLLLSSQKTQFFMSCNNYNEMNLRQLKIEFNVQSGLFCAAMECHQGEVAEQIGENIDGILQVIGDKVSSLVEQLRMQALN
ncbi:MAG: hypothetical protein ACTHLE_14180 [Agriterribacter sp.]